MGISKKSHSVLSDKETQSPMLKIFKDIMHREKNDSEKANLIKKEKQEGKKRKTYSGPLPQSELRSYASSSTERFKRTHASKVPGNDIEQQLYKHQNPDRSQSIPFNSEKRESWWFRKDTDKKKKVNDDTCSCVSCALKKVIGSDYACLGCIALVFTVSVLVAFLVLFRSPTPECPAPEIERQTSPTGGNTELLKSRRQFRSEGSRFNGKHWNDLATNPWRSLPKLVGPDELRDASLSDPIYQEESIDKAAGTLSHILENEKFSDGLTSDKLREFYKRLIQTDARIRKLKQQTEETNRFYNSADNTTPNSDRYKRSLMSINSLSNGESQKRDLDYENKIDLSKFKLFYPPFVAVKDYADVNQKSRIKRLDEEVYNDSAPSGILIENKKLMVQYGPIDRKRNFPKCSHLPKESKSHEKQLKHPFYKNSQRLDELLGQILNKNLDKVIANPFNLDLLFGEKEKCKHSKFEPKAVKNGDEAIKVTKSLDEVTFTSVKKKRVNSVPKTGFWERSSLRKDENDESDELFLPPTTSRYDIALSVSTLLNPDTSEVSKLLKHNAGSPANKRKLMQLNDEDDETLGYEDLKEVLSDYTDTHDEADKQLERDRRSDESATNPKHEAVHNKYNIQSIHNTNWKGPMQLYPDELNMMITNAAMQTLKNEMVNDVKRMSDERIKIKSADTDYVEDYLNNKYSKLAQAYSDYGVLSGKKEYVTMEKNAPADRKALRDEYWREQTSTEKEATVQNESFKKRRNLKLPFQEYEGENLKINIYNITDAKKNSEFSTPIDKYSNLIPDKENKMDSLINKFNKLKQNFKIGNTNKKKQIDQFTSRKQRSLKSVEITNLHNFKGDNLDPKHVRTLENGFNKKEQFEAVKSNLGTNETAESPKDFLRVFSDWFLTLAKLSGEYKENSTATENITSANIKQTTATPSNVTKEVMYPMYDADMIENIGHRSRVLMSVQDSNPNVSSSTLNDTDSEKMTPISIEQGTDSVVKLTTPNTKSSTTMQANVNASDNANKTSVAFHVEKNKTIVKRNVDSNLIFWNDIYDDEYGVKIDYFDNEMRKKHSADKDGLMKRSGKWINRKFKKLGESIRTGYNSNRNWRRTTKMRISRSATNFRSKRGENGLQKKKWKDEETGKPLDFRTLNARMKLICREAIRAVKETINRNVREERDGDAEAMSLMQQLVKLMSDLVDFQVQQKTCSKLPADLADFLQWLISSSDSVNTKDHSLDNVLSGTTANDYNPLKNKELYTVSEIYVAPLGEVHDPKMEYNAALDEVQSLLNLYDEMNLEDKGKLTGVKEYLQDHRDYLLKVLSVYNANNLPMQMMKYYRKRNAPLRFKRHMFQKASSFQNGKKRINATYVKRFRRFTKKSDAKHSKTTVNHFDSLVNEGVRIKKQAGSAADFITTTETQKDEGPSNKSVTVDEIMKL